jgi:hypothetical protein
VDAFGKLLCVSQEWHCFLAANHDWQLLEANLPKFRPSGIPNLERSGEYRRLAIGLEP